MDGPLVFTKSHTYMTKNPKSILLSQPSLFSCSYLWWAVSKWHQQDWDWLAPATVWYAFLWQGSWYSLDNHHEIERNKGATIFILNLIWSCDFSFIMYNFEKYTKYWKLMRLNHHCHDNNVKISRNSCSFSNWLTFPSRVIYSLKRYFPQEG